MSFSFSAQVDKPTQVKQALKDRADGLVRSFPDNPDGAARRDEVTQLTAAAAKALEAGVRGMPAAAAYRLSVSGHRDANGVHALSLSITGLPAG